MKRYFVSGTAAFASDTRLRVISLRLLALGASALLLWRLGPFGTFDDLTSTERLLYWAGLVSFGWFLCVAMLALLPRHWKLSWRLLCAAVLASLPTSVAVAWAEMLLRVQRDLGLADVVVLVGDVLPITSILLFVTHGLIGRPGRQKTVEAPVFQQQRESLVARLPFAKRGDLYALQAQDHYVRVHTSAGQHLLHMRFADALQEVGEEAGVQVHRGWWVANGAVQSTNRAQGRITFRLLDGTDVPVSRTYLQAARRLLG